MQGVDAVYTVESQVWRPLIIAAQYFVGKTRLGLVLVHSNLIEDMPRHVIGHVKDRHHPESCDM